MRAARRIGGGGEQHTYANQNALTLAKSRSGALLEPQHVTGAALHMAGLTARRRQTERNLTQVNSYPGRLDPLTPG